MGVLHRALFTWFELLIFLILLVLRLDQRIQWNWLIVFIPMWLYDAILLIYIFFKILSHCKNGMNQISNQKQQVYHMAAVLLKTGAEILICLRLENEKWDLSAKAVLSPLWILLPALSGYVFYNLVQHSRY